MDTLEFFDLILPAEGLRCLATPRGDGFLNIFGETNQWLADAVAHHDGKRQATVYHACASYKPRHEWAVDLTPAGKQRERTQNNVAYVRSFWVDLDVGDPEPNKPPKYPNQKEAARAILEFALKVGLPTPYLVSSGRGLHAYWPTNGDMVPSLWKPTAMALKAALRAEGVLFDPTRTADAASILRPPGSTHRKGEPRPVVVKLKGVVSSLAVIQAALVPYAARDVSEDEFLPEGGPANGFSLNNSDLTSGVEFRPSSAVEIAQRCGVIGRVRDAGGAVDQPTWFFSLGVLAFTEEGDAICHDWSKGDPRYSAAETDAKLAQIRSKQKPTSCDTLADHNPSICGACPHRGKIRTPYVLGMAESETIEVERRVETPSGWTLKRVTEEAPDGFAFRTINGRKRMMHRVKDADGEISWEVFCDTMVLPLNRLWDKTALYEFEMELPNNERRQFTIEGGALGRGRDSLAGLLGEQEIYVRSGKVGIMQGYLQAWVSRLVETAPLIQASDQFGWKDDTFVLGDVVLHPDGPPTRSMLVRMAKSYGQSVRPKGSLDTWIELVDRAYNAPGQEAFQFMVVNAFAAPLMGLLDKQISGVTVFAHSAGSGAGKTTAQRVGLSAWGDWDHLMLADKKTTANMLWSLIGAYNSLPVVYDELTNMDSATASELVFSVSSGRAKQRMRSDGERNENSNKNWRTILQASGNNPLSEKLNMHRANSEAEIARLFEFTVDATPYLTPNEAAEIFPLFSEHYGWAGQKFAAYIVENRDVVRAMLHKARERLNTSLEITQAERYWSSLLACNLVALSICRSLGLLNFEIAGLKAWMVKHLELNRGGRIASAVNPLDMFGLILADLWPGVLVTAHEGDLRKGEITAPQQRPHGTMTGRAIVPPFEGGATRPRVLYLSAQAVSEWTAKRGVSARELRRALVAAGWTDPEDCRYSLGRGTVEYGATSSYVRCWRVYPDRLGAEAGAVVNERLSVIAGGKGASARTEHA